MGVIIKAEKFDFSGKNLCIILAGLPGVGKSTLALSGPDVLSIDCDNGMSRVNPEHRKDAIIPNKYEEILEGVKEAEGLYKTIVIDTGGALIDLMKDYFIRTEPKAKKADGGFSLQGFGFIKSEFLRLFADLRRNFNVILIFHEVKEKTNEDIFYDILCEGSAKSLVWQPADLGGHVHIMNGKRYIGFTPTAQYNAKSAYGIKGLIEIPELKPGEPNDFLTKLFAQVRKNLAAEVKNEEAEKKAYESAMAAGRAAIATINTPDDVHEINKVMQSIKHGLTSKQELAVEYKARLAELHIVYDRKTRLYKYDGAEAAN